METKEDMGKTRKREEENEEHDTVVIKRRCVDSVEVDSFDKFSQGEDLESCCDPATHTARRPALKPRVLHRFGHTSGLSSRVHKRSPITSGQSPLTPTC